MASLVLAGSVAVQTYGLVQSVNQSQKNIQEQLNLALDQAIRELNTERDVVALSQLMTKKQSGFSSSFIVKDSHQVIIESSHLSGEPEQGSKWIHTNEIVISNESIGKRKSQIKLLSDADEEMTIMRLELSETENEIDKVFMDDGTTDSLISELIVVAQEKRFQNLIGRAEIEGSLKSSLDWKSTLDSADFAQGLTKALLDVGVDAPFHFGVSNAESALLESYHSKDFDINEEQLLATSRLFPDDLLQKDLFLNVALADTTGLLIKGIGVTAITSLLFMLLMIVLFIMVVQKLLSQSKLSQLKSDFINNMSHELKTPLATISLAADTLVHPAFDVKTLPEVSGMIKQEHQRMEEHVDRVLEIASLDKGAFLLNRREVLFSVVKEEIEREMKTLLSSSGAQLKWDFDPDVKLTVDPLHFRSALENIITNGIKYNKNVPVIEVFVHQEPKGNRIDIEDNGVGIAPEDLRHVFDTFFRVQSGNEHQVKGFGLGLSYVKKVVDAHGGKVTISSTLGKGSVVSIWMNERS